MLKFYKQHLRNTPVGAFARFIILSAYAIRDSVKAFAIGIGPVTVKVLGKIWDKLRPLGPSIAAKWHGVRQTSWNIWYRAHYVRRYYWARIRPAFPWLLRSREFTNFTYDLTERNKSYLAAHIAFCLNRPVAEIDGYVEELSKDTALRDAIINKGNDYGRSVGLDRTAQFGRRLGWYALARAMKPRVIVETGVEKGLGSTILCAALMRNREEGHPGRYFGTDIDPAAGRLFTQPYTQLGEILYGDSIESLQKLDDAIDLFINDSDHSAEYEGREYRTVQTKLSPHAVIIGDNAHVTDELYKFSIATGRRFIFFREEPADHWYLGAGIGLSLPSDERQ